MPRLAWLLVESNISDKRSKYCKKVLDADTYGHILAAIIKCHDPGFLKNPELEIITCHSFRAVGNCSTSFFM